MPQVIFGMKKTLFHRNRLAVELFDFVLGWGGCGGSGGDFDHGFGEVLGVGNESPVDFFACLRVGVDGEEGTSGGDGRDQGAGSAFVPFEVAAAVVVSGQRDGINGIGDSGDFHDFGGEDVLVGRES